MQLFTIRTQFKELNCTNSSAISHLQASNLLASIIKIRNEKPHASAINNTLDDPTDNLVEVRLLSRIGRFDRCVWHLFEPRGAHVRSISCQKTGLLRYAETFRKDMSQHAAPGRNFEFIVRLVINRVSVRAVPNGLRTCGTVYKSAVEKGWVELREQFFYVSSNK